MGKASDWLREERRKTLGDWVSFCLDCGFAQRYFDESEGDLPQACPAVREARSDPAARSATRASARSSQSSARPAARSSARRSLRRRRLGSQVADYFDPASGSSTSASAACSVTRRSRPPSGRRCRSERCEPSPGRRGVASRQPRSRGRRASRRTTRESCSGGSRRICENRISVTVSSGVTSRL